MSNLKVIIVMAIFILPFGVLATEDLVRIGGLDITATNYGSIRIGPHKNQDSSGVRFANYYLDLSTWVSATLNGENLVSDGDITETKTVPDWRLYQKATAQALQQPDEKKYVTVYRDDRAFDKHQPLGIEITQELYWQKNRDWAIISFRVKNMNHVALQNLRVGLRLDADVPDKDNKPTANDDMVGKSDNLFYLYDYNQTVEKSNIIGLLPLGENINFTFNWWDVNHDPLTDQQRQQLVPVSKGSLPTTANDYRILITQGTFELKEQQELDITFAIIESKGLDNAVKAAQEAMIYYKANIVPGLKKLPPIAEQYLEQKLPVKYELSQNYPNPFNPSTTIGYALPEDSYVELAIYNIQGKIVTRLVKIQQPAGNYQVVWNGCDESGNRVSSGIYYYQLKTAKFSQTKKMVLFQ